MKSSGYADYAANKLQTTSLWFLKEGRKWKAVESVKSA
jgi:hypothetical protein